jgi:hypothetical protein
MNATEVSGMLTEALEEWLGLGDGLRCQSKHTSYRPDGTTFTDSECGIEATHLVIHCRERFLICANRAALLLGSPGRCRYCRRPVADCWTIAPFG